MVVEFVLELDRILGKIDCMHVNLKGTDASPNSLMRSRVLADESANLDNALAKGAAVGNHVHVSGTNIGRPVVILRNCIVDSRQLLLQVRVCQATRLQFFDNRDEMGIMAISIASPPK